MNQSIQDSLMEDLINNAHILFDDRNRDGSHLSVTPSATANSTPTTSTTTLIGASMSHPLPPAPVGEPAADVNYGSSYTQVATVPPRRRGASDSKVPPQSPTDAGSMRPNVTQDFTPQLPARPGNSIHPSRRVGGQTSRSSAHSAQGQGSINVPPIDAAATSNGVGDDIPRTPLPNPPSEPRSSMDSSIRETSIATNGDGDESTRLGSPETFATAQGTPTSPMTPADEPPEFTLSNARKSHEQSRPSA